jgi:CheY-like chemotaxis protein
MAKRILIADDSVTIQKAFALTFAGEDVSIASARSADEGLALARQARPDLIIADGAMPGRTGYDLCAQVRADAALSGVPVYILSSSQQPYDEARGTSAGADGHLLKPWDTSAFMEKVYAAAGGVSAQPAAPPAPPARTTAASLPASAMEDDYGEISIDSSGPATPLPIVTGAPAVAAAPRPNPSSLPGMGSPPGVPAMRPSLIPGMRPGAMPPGRPGTMPVRPLGGPTAPAPSLPPRPAAPPVGRTMIGLPAAGVPIPGAQRPAAPTAPPMAPLAPAMRSPTAPIAPLAAPVAPAMPFGQPRPRAMTPMPPSDLAMPPRPRAPTPAPLARTREITPPPPVRAREATPVPPVRAREATPTPPPAMVTAAVDQKLAAISAKGPEYAAIAKLSREIIEQVVWEVVPELAEAIIRERLDRQGLPRT